MPYLAIPALVIPLLLAMGALCACFQRRQAQRRGRWRYLTPGLYYWLGLLSGVLVTIVATLIVLGGLVDGVSGLLFTLGFGFASILLALQAIVEEVRWNDEVIERRTVLGTRLSLRWSMLAWFGSEWTGYYWICCYDGPRLRFSRHDNGFEELILKVVQHLPRSGPPAEHAPVQAMVPRPIAVRA